VRSESPAPAAPKTETARAAAPSGYTVQVGAFRQKSEAETKARQLKAKGFESRIEPPESPEDLYLIQVGRFKSRADAVAMQLRLKKSGFASFVKAY
jgi:cell division protein FtsN